MVNYSKKERNYIVFNLKRLLFFSFFLFLTLPVAYAEQDFSLSVHEQDEVEILEGLIQVTKKSLAEQETLLKEMTHFRVCRENFLDNPESAKSATTLVKAALCLNRLIKEGDWTHLFSKDFLEEIAFYTDVGKQHGLK